MVGMCGYLVYLFIDYFVLKLGIIVLEPIEILLFNSYSY